MIFPKRLNAMFSKPFSLQIQIELLQSVPKLCEWKNGEIVQRKEKP